MTMHTALVKSCDTVFYRFAQEMWRRDGGLKPVARPADPMQNRARRFGFGVATGIDLPNESAGRVPDRAWKRAHWESTRAADCAHARTGYPDVADPARAAYLKALAYENCHGGGVWWPGDAANFAIGQGDVLTTPLQLARAYAALANGGTLFSPRIGKALTRPDGTLVKTITPPVAGRLPVPGSVLDFIRRALAQVPRKGGTAAGAFKGFPFDRLAVAGKTGTAEAYGREDTSWFASFAPAASPRYVVVVMVSHGGKGADVAAPAARQIWEGIYGLGGGRG
jgi:penicillin-binding protein 2